MKNVAAAAVVAVLAVLATASPAQAHSYLVDSTPEVGGVLTELPEQFSITANEPLLDLDGQGSGFGIEVSGPDGRYYGDGCITVDGPTMYTAAVLGEPGRYLLVYRFISADGHAVSDQLSFDWAPVGDFVSSAGQLVPGDCDGRYARGDGEAGPAAGPSADLGAVLWIGGALLAVGLAVAATLLALRRRS